MCGISGILHFGRQMDAPERCKRMVSSIRHRGPDDEGYWHDGSLSLGFARLSIVDIAGGHQPMSNEDGRVWVVFNGEIYNHRVLRRELEACGHRFRSDHSDTEVLVHGYEEWGERLPERLNGMFAFAIWDAANQKLFLARDRYGTKPLYVAALDGGSLVFASEIRAIHASGLLTRKANARAILEYFQQQDLWGEETMFTGVMLFPAASCMTVTPANMQKRRYWDYHFPRSWKKGLPEAAGAQKEILEGVIRRQMAADVPVMSYLSGGIDSSSLVAAASKLDPGMTAYSCIFDLTNVGADRFVDERQFSRRVARDLGVRHVELELPATSLQAALAPTVVALEDLRMGMAYVNYLIAERVSRDGKVVLSGTGGDEAFAGYVGRYRVMRDAATAGLVRRILSRLGASGLLSRPKRIGREARDSYASMLNFCVPEARIHSAFTPEFLSIAGDYSVRDRLDTLIRECPHDDLWDVLMYVDARTYLHGLLVIEDRLSMAHSLEARVPLLDNELVDFASDLPWALLTDGETGKIVFREAVRSWVPDEIYRKPKMGFGPPDASWYRTELRDFVCEMLHPRRISARGVFQPAYVTKAVEDHMSSAANNLPFIWSMLCFETWCTVFDQFGGDLGGAERVFTEAALS